MSHQVCGARAGRAQRGFTTLELMVVVAIIGILAALAAANLTKVTERAQVQSINESVISLLTQARATAMAKNATVVVLFDTSSTTTGIYAILDPSNDFLNNYLPPNSKSYVASKGPLAANTTIFSSGTASVMKYMDFSTGAYKAHVAYVTDSTTVGTYKTLIGAANVPWTIAAGSKIAGCTFCSATFGFVAFRGDGVTVLSDPNNANAVLKPGAQGMVMFYDPLKDPSTNAKVDRAMFIATPTGLTSLVEK